LEQFRVLSKFPMGRLYLAAAYTAAGHKEDARNEIGSLRTNVDKLTECVTKYYYRDTGDRDRFKMWVGKAV
jgi:hypothetical protein